MFVLKVAAVPFQENLEGGRVVIDDGAVQEVETLAGRHLPFLSQFVGQQLDAGLVTLQGGPVAGGQAVTVGSCGSQETKF